MKWKQIVAVALPVALGAIGGWVASTYPAVHLAFCAGRL